MDYVEQSIEPNTIGIIGRGAVSITAITEVINLQGIIIIVPNDHIERSAPNELYGLSMMFDDSYLMPDPMKYEIEKDKSDLYKLDFTRPKIQDQVTERKPKHLIKKVIR